MSVFSQLWLWGAIRWRRDEALIEPVIKQVRAAAQPHRPLLFAVDGFAAYVNCIRKVFRDPVRTNKRGRPPLLVWSDPHIVQGVKQRVGRRLVSITRRLAQGSMEQAEALMQATQVGLGRINTAYIERFRGMVRPAAPALQTLIGLVMKCTTQPVEKIFVPMNWSGDAFCALSQQSAIQEPRPC